MHKLILILLMLAAGDSLAAGACKDKDDAVEALHCSYVQFAESTAALLVAEAETLDVMKHWHPDPFEEDRLEKFSEGSRQFIIYRDAECAFEASIRFSVESTDIVEALRLNCQIVLNSQRIDMLKKLFPPLPVI